MTMDEFLKFLEIGKVIFGPLFFWCVYELRKLRQSVEDLNVNYAVQANEVKNLKQRLEKIEDMT